MIRIAAFGALYAFAIGFAGAAYAASGPAGWASGFVIMCLTAIKRL